MSADDAVRRVPLRVAKHRLRDAADDDPVLDRAVRRFVGDVLANSLVALRVERAAHGSQSPLAAALRAAELGILGTGNRGTKGVGRPPADDPPACLVDPRYAARYRALARAHQAVADAVEADGHGDVVVEVPIGHDRRAVPRSMALPLEVRVALRIASRAQADDWQGAALAGDHTPLLTGAARHGRAALRAAAAAYARATPVEAPP